MMDTQPTKPKAYRAYLLNGAGHIIKPLKITASEDSSAIEQAKRYVDGHDVVLWESTRKLAFFARRKFGLRNTASQQETP